MIATLALAPAGGCFAREDDTAMDPTLADIDEWNELAAKLDQRRTQLRDRSVADVHVEGKRLVWAEYRELAPTLHGFSPVTGERIDYGFSPDVDGQAVFRASDQIVVTVELASGMVRYHAWAVGEPERELGVLSLTAPTGIRWYAFAADQGAVYFVVEGAKTELRRWIPGGATTLVLAFEDIGVPVGIFEDFDVAGTTLILIESGRLWHVDLGTQVATWVKNETEVSSVSFDEHSVLYPSARQLLWYDVAQGTTREVAAEIDANPWKVNDSFPNAHHYTADPVLVSGSVLYVGHKGVFLWHPARDEIEPVVLEPHDFAGRTDYVHPVGLTSRDVYVVGLHSDSGATGAEGPFYRVTW